jgi:hypothetical protein
VNRSILKFTGQEYIFVAVSIVITSSKGAESNGWHTLDTNDLSLSRGRLEAEEKENQKEQRRKSVTKRRRHVD